MRAVQTYEWATDKVETVTKQHREAQACERRYSAMPDRQPGENRAAHRARLKAERRARKVPA